jgi:hypothetical protein
VGNGRCNHQGLDSVLIAPTKGTSGTGEVVRRVRLGGNMKPFALGPDRRD